MTENRICAVADCTRYADPDPGHEQLCVIHQAEHGTPRILTDDESYLRRAQQASRIGPRTITLCAIRDCPHPADYGPFCADHRRRYEPAPATVARDLDADQLDALRAQVAADAAPLFVIAVNWLARQQMARLGIDVETIAAGMERIRGELEHETTG